jgi:cobalamin-dependent methionine synthase I
MLIIAERINSSRKTIYQAIERRDAGFIRNEAINQDLSGADYIDVNAGAFFETETENLKWLIDIVQEATSKPLCLDSPDPRVIMELLPMVDRAPMINSITLEKPRLEGLLPAAVERKAKVIGLCQSEGLMADTAEQKIELAEELIEKATQGGLPLDDLYLDPLVYPLATNTGSAEATMEAITRITKGHPGVHTTCGLTNVSHGLPYRKLINRTFLVSAIARGLDSAIMDPTDPQLYGALRAALAVNGRDEFCMQYITDFRAERLG